MRRVLLACALLVACQGEGSDIGPGLGAKPPEQFQVTVFDDGTRPVTGARVEAGGARGVSGRVGRAEAPLLPPGEVVVTVDASAASATAADALGSLVLRARVIDDGRMLDRPVFLPDLGASAGLTQPTGAPIGPLVFDDSAASQAILEFDAGTFLDAGNATTVLIRTAALQARHLPVAPPRDGTKAALASRAIVVEPLGLGIGPAATLSIPNELASATGADVDVWRLDATAGTWVRLGAATVANGRLRAAFLVDRGGLYLFTASIGTTTTVQGRVLGSDGQPIPRAFVAAGGVVTAAGTDGRFALGPIAATDLAANARTETLELIGGRGYLPEAARHVIVLTPGTQDASDLLLDSVRSGHLRILTVERGRGLPDQRVRTGDERGRFGGDAFSDASATAFLEDVPEGFYGVRAGRARDVNQAFLADGIVRLRADERVADLRVFSLAQPWDSNIRGNVVEVIGATTGALLRDAVLSRGVVPGEGFLGRTLEAGVLFTSVGPGDHLTASYVSESASRRVVAAYTIVGTSGHRLQMPVAQVTRSVAGFHRHGLIAGSVDGGTSGRTRRLQAHLPLHFGDWFDRVMLDDGSSGGRVPVKRDVDGAGTTAAFTIGVPLPRGHVSVVEGDASGGPFVLDRAFVRHDLVPAEGQVTALPGAFVTADRTFTARGLLAGLDPRVNAASLTVDWGAASANGTVADAACGLGGASLVAAGQDLSVRLPPLGAGHHHVCVTGRGSAGGYDVEQRAVVSFGAEGDLATRPLLPVPTFTSPAPGAVVSAAGFPIEVALPPGGTYLTFRLTTDDGVELRQWDVIAYGTVTTWAFLTPPPEATALLVPGRTWRLTVAAHRLANGPVAAQANPFNSVIANVGSLRFGALGVDAISSATITITTQ